MKAPVFGVPAVAAKGELNIMAGGPTQAIAVAQPVFDALGQKTWHVGENPRHANIAKIAGNMMIMLAIEAMGEAAALTEAMISRRRTFLRSSQTPCSRALCISVTAATLPITATNRASS